MHLGLPYRIPGVVPTGQILSNSFSEIFSSFFTYATFYYTLDDCNYIKDIFIKNVIML